MGERVTYSVAEVAAQLGISRNSAYEAVRLGEIPSLRFGRRIVVPAAALEQLLLDAGRVDTRRDSVACR